MRRLRISKMTCSGCDRGAVIGWNRPHSLHATKRVVKINLQKRAGRLICTRCWRSQLKSVRVRHSIAGALSHRKLPGRLKNTKKSA